MEIKFEVNSVPIVFISKVKDSGEEHHFNKPRASGFFIGTHIFKTEDGNYEYHEDIILDKDPMGVQNTKSLTYTAYIDIEGKMKRKAFGATQIMWD